MPVIYWYEKSTFNHHSRYKPKQYPPEINMSPKKGPFQKEHSLPTCICSGDIRFWERLLHQLTVDFPVSAPAAQVLCGMGQFLCGPQASEDGFPHCKKFRCWFRVTWEKNNYSSCLGYFSGIILHSEIWGLFHKPFWIIMIPITKQPRCTGKCQLSASNFPSAEWRPFKRRRTTEAHKDYKAGGKRRKVGPGG